MMRKVAVLLTLCAAMGCAPEDPSGESATSESEALIRLSTINPWITATDTAVTVEYAHGNDVGPLTVTLTGPTGTYSAVETSYIVALSSYRTTISGLDACAPFKWAVVSGSTTYASGSIHTRNAGNTACPDGSESLTASSALQLHAVGHMFDGTNGLHYGWYPFGSGWTLKSVPGDGFFTAGSFHYVGENEWFVEAHRARLQWNLNPTQLRRATDAKVVVPYDMGEGDPLCVGKNIVDRNLAMQVWKLTTTQTMNLSPYGNKTWAAALGGPEVDHGLEPRGDGWRSPGVDFAHRTLSLYYGKPTENVIVTGLMGFDRFPSQVNPPPAEAYPQDNDKCRIYFTAPKLVLTYDPLPPNNPINCSVAINCNDATVSCNAGGDVFVIHQMTSAGDVVAATVDMTSNPTTPFTKTVTSSNGPASYRVCTVSGAGESCTPTLVPTSNVACCNNQTYCKGACGLIPTCNGYLDCGSCCPAGFHDGPNGNCVRNTCDADDCDEGCLECNGSSGSCSNQGLCVCKSKAKCQ